MRSLHAGDALVEVAQAACVLALEAVIGSLLGPQPLLHTPVRLVQHCRPANRNHMTWHQGRLPNPPSVLSSFLRKSSRTGLKLILKLTRETSVL